MTIVDALLGDGWMLTLSTDDSTECFAATANFGDGATWLAESLTDQADHQSPVSRALRGRTHPLPLVGGTKARLESLVQFPSETDPLTVLQMAVGSVLSEPDRFQSSVVVAVIELMDMYWIGLWAFSSVAEIESPWRCVASTVFGRGVRGVAASMADRLRNGINENVGLGPSSGRDCVAEVAWYAAHGRSARNGPVALNSDLVSDLFCWVGSDDFQEEVSALRRAVGSFLDVATTRLRMAVSSIGLVAIGGSPVVRGLGECGAELGRNLGGPAVVERSCYWDVLLGWHTRPSRRTVKQPVTLAWTQNPDRPERRERLLEIGDFVPQSQSIQIDVTGSDLADGIEFSAIREQDGYQRVLGSVRCDRAAQPNAEVSLLLHLEVSREGVMRISRAFGDVDFELVDAHQPLIVY